MEDTYEDVCSFCAEINFETENNLFYEMINIGIDCKYILKETQHFVVMPCIGSLMPGYFLVVPKDHVLSFGFLPEEYDDELMNLLNLLTKWISVNLNLMTIWLEHGSSSFRNRGGSCTDHAHLHVIPVPNSVNLVDELQRDFSPTMIETWGKVREQVNQEKSYLLLRHHNESIYICDAKAAKSQHLRRYLTKQLDLGETWDWTIFTGKQHILETIKLCELYSI